MTSTWRNARGLAFLAGFGVSLALVVPSLDRLTPDECAAYTRPNQSSAGCYESPCKFSGTPACP